MVLYKFARMQTKPFYKRQPLIAKRIRDLLQGLGCCDVALPRPFDTLGGLHSYSDCFRHMIQPSFQLEETFLYETAC